MQQLQLRGTNVRRHVNRRPAPRQRANFGVDEVRVATLGKAAVAKTAERGSGLNTANSIASQTALHTELERAATKLLSRIETDPERLKAKVALYLWMPPRYPARRHLKAIVPCSREVTASGFVASSRRANVPALC